MSSMTRLKRVAELRAGGTPTVDEASNWSDEGLPWVAISDMTAQPHVIETERRVSGTGLRAKNLSVGKPGTVLFAMYASVGATATLGVSATWNQAILGIEPKPGLSEGRFLRYWLEHLRGQVANFPFPLLSVNDQRRIADYLDTETARLDALIAKKRRLAELLNERRSVLITDAVTRGDGVKAQPLKRACVDTGQYGLNVAADQYIDNGIRLLRTTDLAQGRVSDSGVYVAGPIEPRFRLECGDLLLSRSGTVGRSFLVPEAQSGAAFAGYLIRFRPRPDVDARYLSYCCESRAFEDQVQSSAIESTIKNFNADRYANVRVFLSALRDQRRIADYLDAETARIQKLQVSLDQQITLLTEHRQALITAAVTGEFAVPGTA